ncbi:MAG: histidine kinase [Spirochaetales bacterium]|nr:histidine kinase [Spirochaetales bacterium]
MTIRNKIFCYNFLIIVLIIALMTGSVNVLTSRTITTKTKNNAQAELDLIKTNMNSIVHNVNNYIISFSIEDDLQDLLKEYPKLPIAPADVYNSYNKALNTYTIIRGLNDYLSSYEIYTRDFQTFGFSLYSGIEQEFNTLDIPLKPFWTGPYLLRNKTTNSDEWMFLVTKKTIDLNRGNYIGNVQFLISEDIFRGIYKDLKKDQGEFFLINSNEDVLSSTNKNYIGKSIYQTIALSHDQMSQLYKNRNGVFKIGKRKYFITIKDYEQLSWNIVYSIPYSEISKEKNLLIYSIFLIGLGCILFSFFVSYGISKNISRPIFVLANVMKSIRKGEMEVRFPETSNNEIGVLGQGFNSLMDRIDELLKTVYSEQKQIRDYEFKLIQSQINPHFLYNSLGMIDSLISIEEYDEAISHVHYLTNFYRLSLSTGKDLISLKQEFEITKSYLEIQKRRYIEYFSYEMTLDKRTEHAIVPKLTLQPIVENAIYHGLKNSKRKGFIRVQSTVEQGDIILKIHDTGIGMKQDSIEKFYKEESRDSFGLNSIDKRIKLLYGEKYGVSIQSQINSYTEILLRMPFLTSEDISDA